MHPNPVTAPANVKIRSKLQFFTVKWWHVKNLPTYYGQRILRKS